MLVSLIHTLQNNEQPSVPTGYLSMYHHKNVDHNIEWIPVKENIGITHGFSCINICRVPRKFFEHEAVVQTSSQGPASVNAMKQTCVIVILAYFT